MITSILIEAYERKVGPIDFTFARIGPDREDQLEQMMQDAIDGKRGPITDAELEQETPDDAES